MDGKPANKAANAKKYELAYSDVLGRYVISRFNADICVCFDV